MIKRWKELRMKKKTKSIIILATGLVLVIAILAICLGYNSSASVKLKKQLDLGQKYLTEQNYEQAVVAFEAAIEIEPKSPDAYLGLADVYISQNNLEKVSVVLQNGYEQTKDENLKTKLDEVNAEIFRLEEEKKKAAGERKEKERRMAEELAAKTVQFDFEFTDFKIAGYDLYEEHFDDLMKDFDIQVYNDIGSFYGNQYFGADGPADGSGNIFFDESKDNIYKAITYHCWDDDYPSFGYTSFCTYFEQGDSIQSWGINVSAFEETKEKLPPFIELPFWPGMSYDELDKILHINQIMENGSQSDVWNVDNVISGTEYSIDSNLGLFTLKTHTDNNIISITIDLYGKHYCSITIWLNEQNRIVESIEVSVHHPSY